MPGQSPHLTDDVVSLDSFALDDVSAHPAGEGEEGLLRSREATPNGERRDMMLYSLLPERTYRQGVQAHCSG